MSDPGRRKRAASRGGPQPNAVAGARFGDAFDAAVGRGFDETSVKTVGTQRRNIVQRLGLHGSAELTKDAIR
jgi:hypothetical protein